MLRSVKNFWSRGTVASNEDEEADEESEEGEDKAIARLSGEDIERILDRVSQQSSFEHDEEFDMLVKAYLRDMNYTSISQAALNIMCGMINAGLVTIPFVAQSTGIPVFIASFALIAIISGYTSIMVISMANEQRVRTLEDLAECAYGPKGFVAVSFMQILFSFSLMCITLNIWADVMGNIFSRVLDREIFLLTTRRGQVLIGAMIILPLCVLKKSLATMRWTSYITVFAVVAALLAVTATYMVDTGLSENVFARHTTIELMSPKDDWWTVLFIGVYCYSCNQKVLTIYSSLRRRTADRWQSAMRRALLAVSILYILFGVFGYISKERKEVRIDNFNFFLDNSEEFKLVFDPARAVVAFCLLLTIPVDSLIAATTWRRLLSKQERLWRFFTCDASGVCKSMFSGLAKYTSPGSIEVEGPHDYRFGGSKGSENGHIASTDATHGSNQSKSNLGKSHKTRSTASHSHSGSMGGNLDSITAVLNKSDLHRSSLHSGGDGEDDLERDTETMSMPLADDSMRNPSEATNPYGLSRMSPSTDNIPSGGNSAEDTLLKPRYSARLLDNPTDKSVSRRMISVDQAVEEGQATICPSRKEAVPVLICWLLCTAVCIGVKHWMYLAATVGTFSVVMLMFIFPSILYFKLRLNSDYSASPICFSWVPNQLFMMVVLVLGSVVMLFDLTADFYYAITGAHIIRDMS